MGRADMQSVMTGRACGQTPPVAGGIQWVAERPSCWEGRAGETRFRRKGTGWSNGGRYLSMGRRHRPGSRGSPSGRETGVSRPGPGTPGTVGDD
ncbi:hypothetical protein GCM10010519_18560 [Streptomyces lactacystinicus]